MSPRERLATARLYLVCDARPREWLRAAVRGGVDLVQLRDKTLDDDGLVAAAAEFRASGALFVLNDRPDLVEACGADGVHVGQEDATPAEARALVGPDRTVRKPWFAIGGLNAANIGAVVERGASRIVVVRALTEAEDVEAAARELRAALEGRVGAARA